VITLRFVSHPGIFDVACKAAQYGFWCSHCDAVMRDGRLLGARFIGGVQARPGDYDAGGFTREFRLDLDADREQSDRYFDFLTSQIGKPYDAAAIIAFYSRRDWQSPEKWFCSELLGAALAECGLFPPEMAVKFSRVTPRDMLLLASMIKKAG